MKENKIKELALNIIFKEVLIKKESIC